MNQPYYGEQSPPRTPVIAKPATDCDNCGGYIQIGQMASIVITGVVDFDAQSGYFVLLDQHGGRVLAYFREEREQTTDQPVMHDSCTAEYCHDHITQEECGNKYCAGCSANLSGR